LRPPIESAQFTSDDFTKVLKEAEAAISMDGVGRAIDNVFIEHLWYTVKYDHIYLIPTDNGVACRAGAAHACATTTKKSYTVR
jgi:putative transposase